MKNVAVVGLGYVGLPLSLLAVEKGFKCIGVDISQARVDELLNGKSFTTDIPEKNLRTALNSGFSISSSFELIGDCHVIVVCVPTPLSIETEKPNLDLLLRAIREVAKRIRKGSLVVLESTVAPGTTEGSVLDIFKAQGLKLDEDFFLAYSPERINPGSGGNDLGQIPKIVSGCSQESLLRATLFYRKLVDQVVTVNGTQEAEFAKLLENSYRLVNVSLVNEFALAAHKMGIDFQEVVRAAATKPYGFQPFFASAGAGGHCIPVDPVYLREEISLRTGHLPDVLNAAIQVNKNIPGRIVKEILATEHPLRNKRILVVGLAYKQGVSDIRNSAALKVIEKLIEGEAHVEVYDPLVQEIMVGSKRFHIINLEKNHDQFDLALFLHPQNEVLIQAIRKKATRLYTTSSLYGRIA